MKKKRLVAMIIDFAIIMLISQVFVFMSFIEQNYLMKITFSIMFSLFLCRDNLNGQSLGKRLMKIQVVDNSTMQTVTSFKYILRNLFLCVWPIELLLVLINGDRRLGDYVAKTKIIINTEAQSIKFKINDLAVFLICFVVVFAFTVLVLKLSTTGFPLTKLLF
jgi:uncharacterized RDD family membrane protein YckC